MSTETTLRQRMTAYAAAVTPGGPDFAGAETSARRQRRARGGAVAGVTVVVIALAAVGITSATTHRADRVLPSAPRDTTGAPLPGFARAAQVTVPSNLDVFTATEADGQVWAVASDPSTNEPILLHGADGQLLQEVHRYPYGDVSDERLAIRGGHALVLSTENDVTGSPEQDAELTVYDDRTTAVLRSVDLTTTYGAAGAYLGAADAGSGPLSVVLAGRGSAALTQQVRTGVVTSDGTISDLTPPLDLRDSPLELGAAPYQPDFTELQLILSSAGRPRYLILMGEAGFVRRLDLVTGTDTRVVVDTRSPADGSGLQASAVGIESGRVLYASADGVASGAVTDDHPALVPGSARLATAEVAVVGGQPYVIRRGEAAQTAQALRPVTLEPYGPVTTTPVNSLVGGGGDVVLVSRPQPAATGIGGTLTAYERSSASPR